MMRGTERAPRTMSGNCRVIWSEGLFLEPQHFQQQDRHLAWLVDARLGAVAENAWGFAALELDSAALALGRIQIAHASGVLPDGTPFDIPGEDPVPPALEVPRDLADELVSLALPLRRAGACEVEESGEDTGLARLAPRDLELADLTTAARRTAPVRVGELRLRLVRGSEATDAYACLGVAQILERRADGALVLDRTYVPAMLRASADSTLDAWMRELHALLHQRGDALAARLAHPGRGGVAEVAEFLLLQTVNRFEPLLAHLAGRAVLHPERLYSACLALAGDLATFTSPRRPASFPPYRHDALRETFAPLAKELRAALSQVLEPSAVPIELQERRFGVRVAVVADRELLRGAAFVLAAAAQMPSETLRARLPTQLKIGPAERIRELVNLQLPGVALHALPVAPRQIPYHAGRSYFELERGGELWQQLERSGGVALHVAGDFPGLELELWAIRG